jgi:hypothetical protein
MYSIKVQMKRGGYLYLEATGRVVDTTDGAGERIVEVDDLQLFWPRKKRDKKSYRVKDELIADFDQVATAFMESVTD